MTTKTILAVCSIVLAGCCGICVSAVPALRQMPNNLDYNKTTEPIKVHNERHK